MAKRISVILLVIFSGPVCLPQTGGDNVYEFLNLTHSGLISSLGGSNISLNGSGLNMSWHNPALLDSSMSGSLALNYSDYLAGINYGLVLYSPELKGPGCLAAGISYLSYGSFTEADIAGNITGSFSASESAFTLIYSHPVDSNFSIGINFKPVISHLERYNSFGFAFDVGISWHNPSNLLSAGLVLRNGGVQLTTYAGEERGKLPFELLAGITVKPAHAPFRISVTARNLGKFDLTHDYNSTADDETENSSGFAEDLLRHLTAGVEIIPHRNFYLSAGYNHQRRSELKSSAGSGGTGLSWGFGLNTSVLAVEFGMASYHLAGSSLHFSAIVKPGLMYHRLRN
ncbi:MAG: type IX secretion system protein PorQ [Bacteroidales bacterium]|jgi:hypothetical protein|nr:type IX secretion system protein PorQ [Bacteroidales bacterium]